MSEEINASKIHDAWQVAKEKHGIIDFDDIRQEILLHRGKEALVAFDADIKRREDEVMKVQGLLGRPRLSSGAKVSSATDNPASFFAGQSFTDLFRNGPA